MGGECHALADTRDIGLQGLGIHGTEFGQNFGMGSPPNSDLLGL